MNIEISWGTLLYIATSIGVIWSAFKSIKEAKKAVSKPFEDNEERMKHIENCLDNDKKRIDNLEENQSRIGEDVQQLLSATVVMLSHMEDGNNTGEIKKKHNELEEYIIKKRR